MATLYLFLATILWGLWGFAYKAAVARASPWTVQWIYSAPYFVLFPLGWVASRSLWPLRPVPGPVIAWSVAAGVCAIAASSLLLLSMRTRPASIAVASTSAYPLVTLVLGAVSGTETIKVTHLLGAFLVIGGVMLLDAT
jgi:drug/metabolite transporter (DMT)-like permease